MISYNLLSMEQALNSFYHREHEKLSSSVQINRIKIIIFFFF